MIDIKKIKDLIKLMVAHDLTELDLEGDGERVTLKRNLGQSHVQLVTSPPAAGSSEAAIVQVANTASPPAANGESATTVDHSGSTIACPMVGTFFTSSSPDAKPFVAVGDHVDEDTVVCIVEAMKVFNEIKAEINGTIEKVLVGSGQAVEFEQPLFKVRPD